MKLLKKFVDKNYEAANHLYTLDSGLRVLHAEKKGIKNVSVTLVFFAGAFFEERLKVPSGTMHFLEHMLCNPNRVLDTKEKQNQYRFGNKKIPAIFTNAYTSTVIMAIEGFSHVKGLQKIINYLSWQLDYPLETLEAQIEAERKIILAELYEYPKLEKDPNYQYIKFSLEQFQPQFAKRVIGTEESIKQITSKDLVTAYNFITNPEYIVLSIQTPENVEITDYVKLINDEIIKISKKHTNKRIISSKKPKDNLSYKFFLDETARSIYLAFAYFRIRDFNYNYLDSVNYYLFQELLRYTGFEFFREKENLVYSFDYFSEYIGWRAQNHGFALAFDPENFKIVLRKIDEFLRYELPGFLQKEEFKKWFDSAISRYIFTNTVNYNKDYADTIAERIASSEFEDFFDFSEAQNIARKLKHETFLEYVDKMLKITFLKPRIWLRYSDNEKELTDSLYNSEIYKRLSSLS